jgi:hypothetical protein
MSRPGLGSAQPRFEWLPRALSLGVKRPGREAVYSHEPSAEVKKNVALCTHSTICLHGAVLNSLSTGKILPFLPFTLKMEAVLSSETSVNCWPTLYRTLEGSTLHSHRYILKSKLLDGFQQTIGTKITIPEKLLNTRDFFLP